MNHDTFPISSSEQLSSDLQEKYGLPDTSEVLLKKIESNIDKGSGVHKGGFIDNLDVPRVKMGPGNRTDKEMIAVDSIARLSFRADGADPVVESGDPSLNGLSIEEARDAAFGGLTLGASIDGNETRINLVVLHDQSPNPDRDRSEDKSGILEKTMFLANGAANPYVVESMSTYKDGEDGSSPYGELKSFTMTRRDASAAEVATYYEVKRSEQ